MSGVSGLGGIFFVASAAAHRVGFGGFLDVAFFGSLAGEASVVFVDAITMSPTVRAVVSGCFALFGGFCVVAF